MKPYEKQALDFMLKSLAHDPNIDADLRRVFEDQLMVSKAEDTANGQARE